MARKLTAFGRGFAGPEGFSPYGRIRQTCSSLSGSQRRGVAGSNPGWRANSRPSAVVLRALKDLVLMSGSVRLAARSAALSAAGPPDRIQDGAQNSRPSAVVLRAQ